GVWCPLFRLHGNRQPRLPFGHDTSGGPNEVWSYGEEVYEILAGVLRLRERIKPYVLEQMALASRDGVPPMRPLWFDFPDDAEAWAVDDEFCFGPSVLVAPVTELGARSRRVYLPAGATWTDPWTEQTLDGGTWADAEAPLDRIPLYLRDGAQLPLR
ncbi:MAG: family 31 glucosidase, partial [Acidimicrobiales bacterium]